MIVMKEKKGVWRLKYLEPTPQYSDEQNDANNTGEST
jgi:hypothetical protein